MAAAQADDRDSRRSAAARRIRTLRRDRAGACRDRPHSHRGCSTKSACGSPANADGVAIPACDLAPDFAGDGAAPSTQTFHPLDAARYLVVLAPNGSDGGRDMKFARGFLVPGDTGISYRADTWHHAHLVLDRLASFAVLMWRDGSADDIEMRQLDAPFLIRLA